MSPKQWLALLCFFISYLFFGASVFYHLEQDMETERRAEAKRERIEINELLVKYAAPDNADLQTEILGKLSIYCSKPVTNFTSDEHDPPYVWSFYHSFFFSFIVCSTIGYGNISPNNTFGKMFMIFYALIGIPVNGFLFAYLGDFFGKTFIGIYRRYKTYKMATTKNYMPMRFSLIGRIVMYLMPGMIFFIFLPSCLFSYFEEWSYTDSIYYSFVTLTTIGFGDKVATFQEHQEREFGVLFTFYQIFIIFWFILGLGYLVMIFGFIAKGMRSKRLTRLEHQLSENIKATQQRIWQGVTKDVGYLRRILNEVYLMKFKPVYTDEVEEVSPYAIPRSASCPNLTMYMQVSPRSVRKRAYSEACNRVLVNGNLNETLVSLARVQSDGDLQRINRTKTFANADTMFENGNILAQVVSALGAIRPTDEDGHSVLELAAAEGGGGVHGFSDSQILASERTWSGWSLPHSDGSYANTPKQKRARAASVFCSAASKVDPSGDAHEWTWSGNNAQIQEFLRTKTKPRKQSIFRTFMGSSKLEPGRSVTISIPDQEPVAAATTTETMLNKLNPFKKRLQDTNNDKRHSMAGPEFEAQRYLDRTARGRESKVSVCTPKQYLQATARGRQSAFSILTSQRDVHPDVLETTTIADLIRALEVVHTKVQKDETSPMLGGMYDSPKRKMGLASLTPPKIPSSPAVGRAGARRGSLRPTPTYTTIFNSKAADLRRRKSHIPHGDDADQPPAYAVANSPSPLKRRFSVRPTHLSIPPGQAPPSTPTAALHRRPSLKPSPLARTTAGQSSGRFARNNFQVAAATAISAGTPNRLHPNDSPASIARNSLWRPAQLQVPRSRHGSVSNLNEHNEREN